MFPYGNNKGVWEYERTTFFGAGHDEDCALCGVLLRDGMVLVSAAVHAGVGDCADDGAGIGGIRIDAEGDICRGVGLSAARDLRLAGVYGRHIGAGANPRADRGILDRLATGLSAGQRAERRDAEFPPLRAGGYRGGHAADVFRRYGVDDARAGYHALAGGDDGRRALHSR